MNRDHLGLNIHGKVWDHVFLDEPAGWDEARPPLDDEVARGSLGLGKHHEWYTDHLKITFCVACYDLSGTFGESSHRLDCRGYQYRHAHTAQVLAPRRAPRLRGRA